MVKIKVDGLKEFQRLVEKAGNENLDNIKVVITNTCRHAWILEYGSTLGRYPWPNPDDDTMVVADIYKGGQKVVSIQGWAMLRGNEQQSKQMLQKELSRIDLKKPIREQVVSILNKVGNYWKEQAKANTPVDTGEAYEGWQIKSYE